MSLIQPWIGLFARTIEKLLDTIQLYVHGQAEYRSRLDAIPSRLTRIWLFCSLTGALRYDLPEAPAKVDRNAINRDLEVALSDVAEIRLLLPAKDGWTNSLRHLECLVLNAYIAQWADNPRRLHEISTKVEAALYEVREQLNSMPRPTLLCAPARHLSCRRQSKF